jgi:flagellar biogenesis protein FliO
MQEMSLGTNESMRIIRVDNQEFVLHVSKNGPASLHPLNSDALAHPQPQQVSIESILPSANKPKPAQEEDIPAFLLKKKMRGR